MSQQATMSIAELQAALAEAQAIAQAAEARATAAEESERVAKAALGKPEAAVPSLRSIAHVERGERNMRYADGAFVSKAGENSQAVSLPRTWFAIGVSDSSAIAYEIRDVHMGVLRDALIAHLTPDA